FAEKIFELVELQPSLTAITSAELGASAARPAFSVMANRALAEAGLSLLRPWEDALEAYLGEKGYLASAVASGTG
ncbi:MAG: sugar nucleotide-binding protein, partial [Chloroflexi bacterium]|nr:sugar nucleotide-binding protein [Chloroflexota bacterium]